MKIVISLGLNPSEPCPDWDRDKSAVTDEDGKVIGYVDTNDGLVVTVYLDSAST